MDILIHETNPENPSCYLNLSHLLPEMGKNMPTDKGAQKVFLKSLKPCVENYKTSMKETTQLIDKCVKEYGQSVRKSINLDEYREESENEESDEDLPEWYDSLCKEVNEDLPKPSTSAESFSQAADPQASTEKFKLNLSDLVKPSTSAGSSLQAADPQASTEEFEQNLSFCLMNDIVKSNPKFFEKKIPKDKLSRALSTPFSATATYKGPDVS